MRIATLLVLATAAGCGPTASRKPLPPGSTPVAIAPATATTRELSVDSESLGEHIKLYVRVASPAAKPKGMIVLVHGGPGISHEYMLPLEKLVDDGYAVVTYDQRGVGKSSTPDRDQSLGEHAVDLDNIRAKLGVEKIDLVAHSYGGLVAMDYASNFTAHVRSLIFVDSMPPKFNDYMAGQYYFGQKLSELQRKGLIPAQLPDAEGADCSKQLIAMLPVYYFDPKHPATANLAGSSCNQAAFDLTTETNKMYDFTGELGRIAVPTLVVQGEADPFTKQMSDAIMAAMSGAKPHLEMLARCGHLPWEECPEPFYAAVRTFLTTRP